MWTINAADDADEEMRRQTVKIVVIKVQQIGEGYNLICIGAVRSIDL